MPPEIDLFAATRGSVTAPAGCGKTQLITDMLCLHRDPKPVLVLTHTNAGVSALRMRLHRAKVPSSAYRLSTIDGFTLRLVSKFPTRSGSTPGSLQLTNPNHDYPDIRNSARQLVIAGHINDAFRATYSRLLVDEYQDCNQSQHGLVTGLAALVPTYVLGDPLQAIFDFRGSRLVDWQQDVQALFPPLGELTTPWRWRQAGADELGHWLLATRARLQAGQPIDLRHAPDAVLWIKLNPAHAAQQRLMAARQAAPTPAGNVLVIGSAVDPRGQRHLASHTPGAMAVERADLTDLTDFCRVFDVKAPDALERLVRFASELMTGIGATPLLNRVQTILKGRNRTPPTPAEAAAADFASAPSIQAALALINRLKEQSSTRVYRPELLYCWLSALQVASGGSVSLPEAATLIRERNRHGGRPLAKRSVGSTLLLKGLEADVAVILFPEQMTAPHLYVALTRGARKIVICSTSPVLTPAER